MPASFTGRKSRLTPAQAVILYGAGALLLGFGIVSLAAESLFLLLLLPPLFLAAITYPRWVYVTLTGVAALVSVGVVTDFLTHFSRSLHTTTALVLTVVPVCEMLLRVVEWRRAAEAERGRLLEREQAARRDAEQSRERLAFLAEASAVLTSSLDYETTLEAVARLALPRLGDFCIVDLAVDPEPLHTVAVAATCPEEECRVWEMRRRYGLRRGSPHGVAVTFTTGKSELVPHLTDALLAQIARDPDHLRILQDLGLRSLMRVPLVARDRTLGVLTFSARQPGRYGAADLELAEELARRAAVAVDNARLHRAAREAAAHYGAIFESAAMGIGRFDMQGRIQEANHALEQMLAYGPGELVGHVFTDVTHPEDRDSDWELFAEVVAGRREAYQIEKRFVRQDGQVVWGCLSASVVRDAEGNPEFGIGMVEDITRRKELEEQLLQSRKLEAIGQLAGGVAHDFNNMLAVITGYADLLLAQPEGATSRSGLEEIRRAGERAAGLTAQLLAFSRRQLLVPQELDLNVIVAELGKMLRRLLGERIELETLLDPDLAPVRADAPKIEQALLNLALNARDAMPEGGRLTLATGCEVIEAPQDSGAASDSPAAPPLPPGRYVTVTVSDTGVGMDEATQARIFEPFFTTKGVGEGTGLGLASVYGVIRQSGGDIRVTSAQGRGTTFRIYLPAAAALTLREPARSGSSSSSSSTNPALAGTPAPPHPLAPPPTHATVLLVEDEDLVRQLTRDVLEMEGYHVVEAADGETALRVAEALPGPIDLLLSDIVMPGLNGPQVAARLRERQPDLPVLFMSGYAAEEVLRFGVSPTETPFLSKPFHPTALRDRLREVLELAADDPRPAPAGPAVVRDAVANAPEN